WIVDHTLGFSGSIGGGFKAAISKRLAFKLEVLGYGTINDAAIAVSCGPGCDIRFAAGGWYQLEARAGLAIHLVSRPSEVDSSGPGTRGLFPPAGQRRELRVICLAHESGRTLRMTGWRRLERYSWVLGVSLLLTWAALRGYGAWASSRAVEEFEERLAPPARARWAGKRRPHADGEPAPGSGPAIGAPTSPPGDS